MASLDMVTILEAIQVLTKRLDDLIKTSVATQDDYQSLEVNKISEAFAKAQAEYPLLKNDAAIQGRYTSLPFASLSFILETVRPSLTKHGLSFHQYLEDNNGIIMLRSRLRHSSGQWFETRMRVLAKEDTLDAFESLVVAYRRMSALMLLGIHPEKQDDYGEAAMRRTNDTFAKGTQLNHTEHHTTKSDRTTYVPITAEQLEELEYELKDYPDIAADVLTKLNLRTLGDMEKKDYRTSVQKIREIKMLRERKQ